jgi:hypothetical protein
VQHRSRRRRRASSTCCGRRRSCGVGSRCSGGRASPVSTQCAACMPDACARAPCILAPLSSVRAGSPASAPITAPSRTYARAYADACTCVVSRRTTSGPVSRAAPRRARRRARQQPAAAAAARRGRASARTYAPTGSSRSSRVGLACTRYDLAAPRRDGPHP